MVEICRMSWNEWKVISLLFIVVCSPFEEIVKDCIGVMKGVPRTKLCCKFRTTTKFAGIPILSLKIRALVNLY